MHGISKAKYKDGKEYYRVSVTFHSRHISLGSSENIDIALQIFDSAKKALYSSYSVSDWLSRPLPSLSFSKFISLINFRDNGIYIKSPVYLRKSFFSYFLDEDTELKFDMDDLFFYSGHIIMRRGNHLFFSSYGLQENLASRYGIRSFAKENRDYKFVNGDNTDFRYSNIKIINHFTGITAIQEGRDTVYKVKIHVNGDWQLGTYPTEEMAAVAYNKALDEIKKRKLKPRSSLLYIDGISAKEYADIYSRIHLPQKFIDHLSAYDMKQMS